MLGTAKKRTWFPILVGVLLGMVAWFVFGTLESPSFYRLTAWIFKETNPKSLYAMPAYYCVHRTLLLLLAGIGGSFGIALSSWAFSKCILFLLGTLIVMAIFATLGFH